MSLLKTEDPTESCFVKHYDPENNLADFIQYCNRLRPQVKQETGRVCIKVFMYKIKDEDGVKEYLRNVHKIHFLYTLADPTETEKAIYLSLADKKRIERFEDADGFFRNHKRMLFALEHWDQVDLAKDVEKLRQEVQELKDMILYAPGGPLFKEAKAHYEELANNNIQDPSACYPLPKKHKNEK